MEDIDSLDDLIEANPINEESVSDAAAEWRENPPDAEFTEILEAEEV